MKTIDIQNKIDEINTIELIMKESNLNSISELKNYYLNKQSEIKQENFNNILEIREDILNRYLNKELLKDEQTKLYYELKKRLITGQL